MGAPVTITDLSIAGLSSVVTLLLAVCGWLAARIISKRDATEGAIFEEIKAFRAELALELRELRERLVRIETEAADFRARRDNFDAVRRNAERANEKADRIFSILEASNINDNRIKVINHGRDQGN
jgi:hypothetical protein